MVIKVEKIQRNEEKTLARTARLLVRKKALEYLQKPTEEIDSMLLKVKKDFDDIIKLKKVK
jgi:hypothetical protein